jgi:hypothetical protein
MEEPGFGGTAHGEAGRIRKTDGWHLIGNGMHAAIASMTGNGSTAPTTIIKK